MKTLEQKKYSKYIPMSISVMGAVLFWVFNALNQGGYTTQINYPIQFQYEYDQELVVMEPAPGELSLLIKGRGWNIFKKSLSIGESPVIYAIENPISTKAILGSEILDTFKQYIKDVNVVSVLNDTIKFDLQPISERVLPIKVQNDNIDLGDNFTLKNKLQISEKKVKVIGPKSIIKELNKTLTISPATKIDEAKQHALTFELSSVLPETIRAEPATITVEFETETIEISPSDSVQNEDS